MGDVEENVNVFSQRKEDEQQRKREQRRDGSTSHRWRSVSRATAYSLMGG